MKHCRSYWDKIVKYVQNHFSDRYGYNDENKKRYIAIRIQFKKKNEYFVDL